MKTKILISALGFAGLLGASAAPELPKDMHHWLIEMHSAQVDLLKINWGQPGFCTEWDRDYKSRTRSCGRRGKLLERHYTR
jgi:hypothetical protein